MSKNRHSICLVALMGLPASGKSTLAQKIVQETNSPQNKTGMFAISLKYDDFVPHKVQERLVDLSRQQQDKNKISQEGHEEMISEEETGTKIFRRKFIQCVNHVIVSILNPQNPDVTNFLENLEILEEILPNSHLVEITRHILAKIHTELNPTSADHSSILLLVDDNHYYSSMRADLFALSKRHTLGFCTFHLTTPVAICLARNSSRRDEERVPDSTIFEMEHKLEPPRSNEPFSLEINTDDVSGILDLVRDAIRHPVLNEENGKEVERRICHRNEVHQADKILRKWVASEVQRLRGEEQEHGANINIGNQLNSKRIRLLDRLRSGDAKISAELGDDDEIRSLFRQEVISLVEEI
ncbi:L-seryl-tRNA(Sec) kinase [Folsomia candida]|uniref:L-seryl-tRNA(Sec) kinase n=1 Tax=Folsomia candida TaxID=158441 RepID=UPI000B8FB5D0|nr:L-seryl-tRNA(Sec) kinase [Folsomia candida]